jgi:choline kinase
MCIAELHCVIDLRKVATKLDGKLKDICHVVCSWLGPTCEVVHLVQMHGHTVAVVPMKLERFADKWEAYWAWLVHWACTHSRSKCVFLHNDMQYGNILRLKTLRLGEPVHHKVHAHTR